MKFAFNAVILFYFYSRHHQSDQSLKKNIKKKTKNAGGIEGKMPMRMKLQLFGSSIQTSEPA